MARIRMMETITGGRYDGRPWPAMGVAFHVPDWEAAELVAAKHAVYESDPALDPPPQPPQRKAPAVPAPAPAPVPAPVTVQAPASQPAPVPAAFYDEADEESQDEDEALRPAVNQPKAAWVAWAVSQGAEAAEAEAMTKADLMSSYGARL